MSEGMPEASGTPNDSELIADIRRRLCRIPEIENWPDVMVLVERPLRSRRPSWGLTLDTCESLGGVREEAYPAAAVIYCLLYSIHLVDDILDEDPDGMHHRFGAGGSSNAALGFQSAAGLMLPDLGLSAAAEAEAHRRLAQTCLGTAFGQMLDSLDVGGEEAYWRVVDLKTPPLFSFAFFLGALVASADIELADRVSKLGISLGRLIQMSDDLHDAMERPAAPDWQRQGTNLAILYACEADHAEREEFLQLKQRVHEPEALERAQDILLKCGAFSYCSYQLIQAHREARHEMAALELPAEGVMVDLFDYYVRPLKKLLASVGVEAPGELFEAGG